MGNSAIRLNGYGKDKYKKAYLVMFFSFFFTAILV